MPNAPREGEGRQQHDDDRDKTPRERQAPGRDSPEQQQTGRRNKQDGRGDRKRGRPGEGDDMDRPSVEGEE